MTARLACWAALAAASGGCVATIRPPARPADPVPVAVIDYGYHASLVLPAGEGGAVEFAYGEWDWFVLNLDSWIRLFPALCCPTPGALGRRALSMPPDPARLRASIRCEEILAFEVGRAEAEALLRRLEARWASRADAPVHNPVVGLTFVPDERDYCAAANCNTVLALWLRQLGCRVSTPPADARFRLEKETP